MEQYENIEKYLQGSLKGEALKEFEAALKKDPALVEEVNLHRKLGNFLGNTAALDFRKNLANISNGITSLSDLKPPKKPGINGGTIIGSLGAIAILGFIIYWFLSGSSTEELVNVTNEEEKLELAVVDTNQEDITTPIVEDLTNPPEKSYSDDNPDQKPLKKEEPIAKYDPYQPNSELEKLLDTEQHSKVHDFQLAANVEKDTFFVNGDLASSKLPDNRPFILEVFDNLPSNYNQNPIFRTPLNPKLEDEDLNFAMAGGKKTFYIELDTVLILKPGIHYFQIVFSNEDKPLFVGKFEK